MDWKTRLPEWNKRIQFTVRKTERGILRDWRNFSFWQKISWVLFLFIAPIMLILIFGLLLGLALVVAIIVIIGGALIHILDEPTEFERRRSGRVESRDRGVYRPVPPPPVPTPPRVHKGKEKPILPPIIPGPTPRDEEKEEEEKE